MVGDSETYANAINAKLAQFVQNCCMKLYLCVQSKVRSVNYFCDPENLSYN